MRLPVFIIVMLLHLGLYASTVHNDVLEPKRLADSIYAQLSETAKANHWVWLEYENEDVDPQEKISELVGGIVISSAHDMSALPSSLTKVLRLDANLSNLHSKVELPYLHTLLAIEDPGIRSQWYGLISKVGREKGFDHLILPDLSQGSSYLSNIVHEIHQFDTAYFFLSDQLSRATETKRRSFYQKLQINGPTLIKSSEWAKYRKLLEKGPKKNQVNAENITEHLSQNLKPDTPLSSAESSAADRLFKKTLKSSIIPLLKDEVILPVHSDTIAIWTTRPMVEQQLRVYFNTVLNAAYEQIPNHIPLVIDGRDNPFIALDVALNHSRNTAIIWIGSAETLMDVQPAALLLTTQNHTSLDAVIPEMLYGSEPIRGVLNQPIPAFLADYRFDPIKQQQLLGYALPEWVGMNKEQLDSMDVLAEEMISAYATPGAQLLVAREGKIILNKNYGFLTYDSLIPVNKHTVFDLASLTKVTATLLAVMKLDQEGMIHLDSTVGHYLPEFQSTNKSKITIRQLLSHQGGLKSYLPFWKRSLEGDFMDVFYYKSADDKEQDKRSYGYQPDPAMLDSLVGWIKHSPLISSDSLPPYLYSDLGFMVLHQIVESVSGQSMDDFLEHQFYRPLGMESTCFNPLSKGFELYEIAPTEYDYYFRDEQVWGYVHDRNAAVFGGVAGHAGLFSNAGDLALLLQMMLQQGNYRNQQFIESQQLSDYNQQYFNGNRRGLGWDKPGVYNPNISSLASPESFGHTGFTGTMVWVDPVSELIFIFLSNRIFPDSNNKKLIQLDTRKRMHDLVYHSMSDHQLEQNK